MRKTQSKYIFGLKNVNNKAVLREMAKMWFKYSVFSSKSTACYVSQSYLFFLTQAKFKYV